MNCQFQVSRSDPVYPRKPKMEDCGDPASLCRLDGELASTEIPLCKEHRQFMAEKYHWKVIILKEGVTQ